LTLLVWVKREEAIISVFAGLLTYISSKYAIECTDGLEYLYSSTRKFALDHYSKEGIQAREFLTEQRRGQFGS